MAYNLQVVGEAAYKVSDAFKSAHPEVDWFKIAGLRHRIVHDYRRIDVRPYGASPRSMCRRWWSN